jgi:hypothetical protein
MSFIIPGAIIGFMGFIIFLFLVTDPRSVGCHPPDHHGNRQEAVTICFPFRPRVIKQLSQYFIIV